MNIRLARCVVCIALVCYLACAAGCGRSGAPINKQTAEKIQAGMAESEVIALLGPPTESVETAVPGAEVIANMKLPDGIEPPKMPKTAKQSTWREGGREIAVVFADGKVVMAAFADGAAAANSKEIAPPDSSKYAPPVIPSGISDTPFEQTGKFTAIKDEDGVVNFPIPYALPPNVETSGPDSGTVVIKEVKATGFKWKGVGETHWGGLINWNSKGVKATKLPDADAK